jgi:hypothetical protein
MTGMASVFTDGRDPGANEIAPWSPWPDLRFHAGLVRIRSDFTTGTAPGDAWRYTRSAIGHIATGRSQNEEAKEIKCFLFFIP